MKIKKWFRAKKEALICGNFDGLCKKTKKYSNNVLKILKKSFDKIGLSANHSTQRDRGIILVDQYYTDISCILTTIQKHIILTKLYIIFSY